MNFFLEKLKYTNKMINNTCHLIYEIFELIYIFLFTYTKQTFSIYKSKIFILYNFYNYFIYLSFVAKGAQARMPVIILLINKLHIKKILFDHLCLLKLHLKARRNLTLKRIIYKLKTLKCIIFPSKKILSLKYFKLKKR